MTLPVKAIYTIDGKQIPVDYTPKQAPFVQHDKNLSVPNNGKQYVQVLWDYDIYDGMSRQESDGAKEKFDFPMAANAAYGLHRTYPGFTGRNYVYAAMHESHYHLIYEFVKWAANYRLEEGKITYWYEKVSNRKTGRISYTEPVRKKDDGGWFANVEPQSSYLWALNELTMKGKALTDADNIEYGGYDPVTGRNKGAKIYQWLQGFFGGSLHEAAENRGQYWGFPCIDTTQPAPSFESVLEKGLYHWANAVSRYRLPNKRNIVSDFPCVAEALKAAGLPTVGTAVPTFGRGNMIWIKKSSCSPILPAGTAWSPYKKLW